MRRENKNQYMKTNGKLYITYFVLFCAVILTTISTAQAKTFLVNVDTDLPDKTPGDGICYAAYRTCTLRAAIEEANALAGADTIEFSASFQAPNPPRTIVLSLGKQITIHDETTINGPGARQLMVDGNHQTRVFHIGNLAQSVSITKLTIQNGYSYVVPFAAYASGIVNFHASVFLSGVTLRGNSTIGDDPMLGEQGGAIFNGEDGTMVIEDSTVSDNKAGVGGGIYNEGTMYIYNSTITNNLSQNTAGGLLTSGFTVIRNSTISNNAASGLGGNAGNGYGAGILTWNNPLYLGNTIVANNFAPDAADVRGTIVSMGNNLVKKRGPSTGYVASDLPNGTDPKLGTLKNNGGQTDTRALLDLSPAINAGNDCIVLGNPCTGEFQFDQRGFGFPRKNGSAVDIGAVEYQPTITAFVPIGGRVFKSGGRGLSRAIVTLQQQDGTTRSVETDAQGRFSFDNVETGRAYVIKVENGQPDYEPRALVVTEARNDLNLVPVDNQPEPEIPPQ
jgi:hypothetical protein